MTGKIIIEKPSEFYWEVRKLIDAHYQGIKSFGSFTGEYPVIYELYLRIAAMGLDKA